jgi:hypothetical protein
MKKLLIGLFVLSSVSAFANSNLALLDIDCPDCHYPPVTSSTNFTFEEAARNFATAKSISPAELVGSWKQIAGTQIADVFRASTNMGYNEEGIKNASGRVLSLEVSTTTISGGFFEIDPNNKITIIIKNLGDGEQGPYEIIPNGAGQACFATKPYDGNGKSFFSFECRKLTKNNSKILCGIALNSNGAILHSSQKPYDGKIGIYLGFVRK